MKVLILRGNDRHTIRLEQGLQGAGLATYTVTDPLNIPTNNFDFAFIDPSFRLYFNTINADKKFFFDSEDDPRHFDKGPAYEIMKPHVLGYAKMNYYDEDNREDGIKNIGFPLSIYRTCIDIAKIEVPYIDRFIPTLISSPTFIGVYEPIENGIYNSEEKLTCLGKYEDGNLMYNQRVDWLLSLRKNKIRYQGGIVFHEGNNLSYEWQSKYFGPKIASLATQPLSYNDTIKLLLDNKIGLCPTGHDRLSWRTYDIMAAGAILIRTDHKKQLALINPKEYITIQDGQDLGKELLKLQPHYKELWLKHQINREIFKTLIPEKLIKLFLTQLE